MTKAKTITEYPHARCPRCGSPLITNGEKVWCTYVGSGYNGERHSLNKACAFGLDAPVTFAEMNARSKAEQVDAQQAFKLWQHEETGHRCWRVESPGPRWYQVPMMCEDELPKDISQEDYAFWFNESIVDGVRIGPKVQAPISHDSARDCAIASESVLKKDWE